MHMLDFNNEKNYQNVASIMPIKNHYKIYGFQQMWIAKDLRKKDGGLQLYVSR